MRLLTEKMSLIFSYLSVYLVFIVLFHGTHNSVNPDSDIIGSCFQHWINFFSIFTSVPSVDFCGSPGQVVRGGDLQSTSCDFESHHWILGRWFCTFIYWWIERLNVNKKKPIIFFYLILLTLGQNNFAVHCGSNKAYLAPMLVVFKVSLRPLGYIAIRNDIQSSTLLNYLREWNFIFCQIMPDFNLRNRKFSEIRPLLIFNPPLTWKTRN